MPPITHHLFVCTQEPPDDRPHCRSAGSAAVMRELREQLAAQGLTDSVQLVGCGCLGLCGRGPNLVVFPEGTWYSGLQEGDVAELVASHLRGGVPVARLLAPPREQRDLEIQQQSSRNRDLRQVMREAGMPPVRLLQLANDFWASRIFLSAVELDFFSAVGDGGSAGLVAEKTGTAPRAARMMLDALSALDLLRKEGETYYNTPGTARSLRQGAPDDARAALMNRVHMWDRWSHLTECVREGSAMDSDTRAPSVTRAYLAATHRVASLVAPELVRTLDLQHVQRVLDVGGGTGAYTVAVLEAHPGATGVILDLPSVIRYARGHVRDAGMAERIELREGDFNLDALGSGFDLVLLSHVLHLNAEEANRRLLGRVMSALQPGGAVVINDYVVNAARTAPRTAALYALNVLVSTREGDVYSYDQLAQWLAACGFAQIRKQPLPGPTDTITARKP